ncbi:rap1 GTPase-GDP dissociation stimulator 1-like isoform X2 [Dysidea avara]|uniref:rap1 GTPase-GDP dissociation stimulator 1-like isoform X2 n=1 Tax=Dysidea avara TaxID=196820 RepID=UPI00332A79E6
MTERLPEEIIQRGSQEEVSDAIENDLKLLASGEEVNHSEMFFASLLQVTDKYPVLITKVTELIANLARQDDERKAACKANLLLPMLSQLKNSPHDVQFQTLRAVGNLTYEYEDSRTVFLENGGCEQLARVLNSYSGLPASPDNERLKCVICGCLSNTCSEQNDKIGKEYIRLGVHIAIITILRTPEETANVITLSLQALSALITSDVTLSDVLIDTKLPSILTSLISQCAEKDDLPFTEPLVDILSTFIEKDKWKMTMLDCGCVNHLLSVRNTAEYAQKFVDLVVLILMEDRCMEKLFDEGTVLKKAIEWMGEGNDDLSLKTTAALIVANIARNDANCIRLIESGVVPHLIKLTQLPLPDQQVAKVYHAALSGLRNLALPEQTKPQLFKDGVVDAAVKMLNCTMSFVQFKALGTLRLMTQKQADVCVHIIKCEGVVKKLTELCADSSTGGHLTAEGSRLLSNLVKYSQNGDVMKQVATGGGCKWIVTLLDSDHNVMVNEGLIATSLLIALNSEDVTKIILECDLLIKIHKILENDKATPEILFNSISLLETLLKTGTQLASQPNIKEAIGKLQSHSNDAVKTKADSLFSNI